MNPLDNSAIADTVAAVFRSRPFADRGSISLGQIVAQWVWNLIVRIFGFAATHPAVGMVFRVALAVALIAMLARIAYGLLIRFSPSVGMRRHVDVRRARDWWSVAQDLAAHGDYTGAAHALYLALLAAAAHAGSVSLHESKTTGDYLREIGRKPGEFDLHRFTDFTRSYETVIYGVGSCDAERYSGLNALADAILGRSIAPVTLIAPPAFRT